MPTLTIELPGFLGRKPVKATVEQLTRIRAWKEANRERVRSNQAAWYQANSERINEPKRLSPEEKKRRANARRAKWRLRPEVRAREKEQRQRYRRTPEYRAKMAAWWKSPEGKAYKKAWRGRATSRIASRNGHRRHKYGLTDAQYLQMVAAQEGRCLGCLVASDELEVDHDHLTGRVRGLLCPPCNRALGWARDDPLTLRRLAAYLGEA